MWQGHGKGDRIWGLQDFGVRRGGACRLGRLRTCLAAGDALSSSFESFRELSWDNAALFWISGCVFRSCSDLSAEQVRAILRSIRRRSHTKYTLFPSLLRSCLAPSLLLAFPVPLPFFYSSLLRDRFSDLPKQNSTRTPKYRRFRYAFLLPMDTTCR